MGRLDEYVAALKASLEDIEKTLASLDHLLVMHEKYRLTDAQGETNLRADLTAQARLRDRYYEFLRAAEANND